METIYETYKPRIEGQHRQVEAWMDSAIPAPCIDSRLQLVDGGLQLYIRYPVELRQGSVVDQQITRSVVTLMETDNDVKSAVSATSYNPSSRQRLVVSLSAKILKPISILDQSASTLALTSAGMASICGHGLMKPSAAHFLVASIPIFDP